MAPVAQPHEPGVAVSYMVQLDGIRAFAVLGVIVEHWAGGLPAAVRSAVERFDLGGWGVECFFVLSGFLITTLLLDGKARRQPLGTALGHFYSRRALRIFPAYYLLLLVAALVSPVMRHYFGWHALYLGNLYPLWHGSFVPVGGHFWSLAVEEQFYLFWPLAVLLTPPHRLVPVVAALCALGPLTRWGLWWAMGGAHLSMWTFPTTAFDLLGYGALLACARRRLPLTASHPVAKAVRRAGLAALAVHVAIATAWPDSAAFVVLHRSLAALIFGALVLQASLRFTGPVARVLENRVVVWLGMVSYGLYLFHPFVPLLYRWALGAFDLGPAWGHYTVRYPLLALLLLAMTSASFYLWEQPIRRYRSRFA